VTQAGTDHASNSSSNSNLYRNLLIGLVALIVAGIVITLVVVVTSGDDSASAGEVFTEPISTPSADPFAPAPPTTPDVAVPPVQTPEITTVEGGHVGLYGGTLNVATCDKNQLVIFLQQNPDKAAAWAGVVGITVAQIPSYVAGLTPVLLRSDTLITNHGYSNGSVTVIPAVLQAGTAVLVDNKGEPVTKCYCGNPLSPPVFYSPGFSPKYTGPVWQGFTPTSITIIQNNTTIIDTFTLVDPQTKQPFTRPAGTDGTQDVPRTPPTTTTTAPPPLATTLPTVTTPQTTPPQTQPPVTAPPTTQPAGPSPEQQAIDKLNNGANQCYPFPAPIEQGYGQNSVTAGPPGANPFTLQVVTHNQDGSPLQTFLWSVDRNTLAFTPTNDLAQAASNHCSALR
jgi:hypothetical protein